MTRLTRHVGALALCVLCIPGCTSGMSETTEAEAKKEEVKPDPKLFREVEQPGVTTPGTKVGPGVDTDLEPGAPVLARGRKRVNIDQLEGMLRQATGFGWEKNGRNQFEELSDTLGKPDLIGQLEEDLSPTILFQKFLADAARSSCDRSAKAELEGKAPEEARLLIHAGLEDTWESAPQKIEANMQALLLRFHSQDLAPGSPQLQPWTDLFSKAMGDETYNKDRKKGEAPVAAWRLVCVALVTHPDFYLY